MKQLLTLKSTVNDLLIDNKFVILTILKNSYKELSSLKCSLSETKEIKDIKIISITSQAITFKHMKYSIKFSFYYRDTPFELEHDFLHCYRCSLFDDIDSFNEVLENNSIFNCCKYLNSQ